MQVITERPIYSYLTAEEEMAEKKKKKAEKAQKRKQTLDTIVQSDYTKALVGVGAGKLQQYASTGSFGNQAPLQFDPNAFNPQAQQNQTLVDDGRGGDKKGMGIWTKVGIGVGIVAVLGIATYFILSSKKSTKGKSSKK